MTIDEEDSRNLDDDVFGQSGCDFGEEFHYFLRKGTKGFTIHPHLVRIARGADSSTGTVITESFDRVNIITDGVGTSFRAT